MKKLIMIIIMMVAATTAVSANFVDDYYGIDWGTEKENEPLGKCYNEEIFKSQIQEFNSDPYFLEAISLFEDGYHIMHFKGASYKGYEYYTIYKNDGRVIYVANGFCAPGNRDYSLYSTDIDLEATQKRIYAAYYNGESLDLFAEGYSIMKSIDGLSLIQKYKLVRIGSKYLENNDPLR
jgi:hypothetical protein